MPKKYNIGLVMATLSEAKPFIEGLNLVEKKDMSFPVFSNRDLILVICGIGKVNAGMGTTYCLMEFKPSVVCNLGAAGSTTPTSSLGDTFHISKIYEFDRPTLRTDQPHVNEADILNGFSPVPIATQDRPILLPAEREDVSRLAHLVDMEAAGVAQACKKFGTTCFIFKFVSDTPDHTEGNDIVVNIKKFRTPFYTFFNDHVLPKLQTNYV